MGDANSEDLYESMPSFFVYFGLTIAGIGLISMIRPIRVIGIANRRRAAYVIGSGVTLATVGAILPARESSSQTRSMLLDDFVPRYQFHEVHSIEVHAAPDAVYAAMKQVTAREIRFFRILTWIRSPHIRSSTESILAPPPDAPLLDVATRSGFIVLGEEPPRELVFGTVGGAPVNVSNPTAGDFRNLTRPGYAKIAMNFTITARSVDSSTLRTETRVYATDESARRKFGVYWRMIYPGSAIIRMMWLRAVKHRAERQTPPTPSGTHNGQ